jgi:hypothetical protein
VPEFVFAETDIRTRRVHLTYLIGLAQMGLGQLEAARSAFEDVLALASNHSDARQRLQELD